MKVRVPLHGKAQGFATLDTSATNGAVVGSNLFWPDGSLVTAADFSGSTSDDGNTRTLWSLLVDIPVNVQAVADLASDGFVRKSGDVWSAASPQATEIAYDNTASGLSSTTVQAAIDEVAGGGVVLRSRFTLTADDVAGVGGDFVYFLDGANLALASAVGNTGLYYIKNVGASSQDVTPDGTETIDGTAGALTLASLDAVTLVSDGANWGIV